MTDVRQRVRDAVDQFPTWTTVTLDKADVITLLDWVGTAPMLAELGLTVGDIVRFKRNETAQSWTTGTVRGRNKDGSVELFDGKAIRAITPGRLEMKTKGPRGGTHWRPLPEGDTCTS